MFKFVLAASLVAAAMAEADAFYGYGGLPYAHHAVAAHVPFGSSTGLDPLTQGLDASTQGFAPYAHAYGHYAYGKRSADAFYGVPYAHHAVAAHVPFGSSTGLDPLTQGLDASTQGFAPYAHAYGHYAYGKRSADAFYGVPYAHHAVAAHVPFGSSTGLDPLTQGLDASTQGFAPYAGHYGHYAYGKRSADAYYGVLPYAHHAVAYAGVPFGSSTGLDALTQGLDASTQGLAPYAHHYYGKREADPFYAHHGLAYAAHVPFGSSTGLDPITQGLDPVTQGAVPYYGYGHHAYGHVGAYYG